MGDPGAPLRVFEEALTGAFGERASEFSDALKASLLHLYECGRREGERAKSEQPLMLHVLKARQPKETDPAYLVGWTEAEAEMRMLKKDSEQ